MNAHISPSEICAVVAEQPQRKRTTQKSRASSRSVGRTVKPASNKLRRIQLDVDARESAPSAPIASSAAIDATQPAQRPPRAGKPKTGSRANAYTKTSMGSPAAGSPIADGLFDSETHQRFAIGTPSTPAAMSSQPDLQTPEWASGHIPLAPYNPEPVAGIIDEIVNLHRRRQAVIRAKTKVILMMKAEVRSLLCRESDFEEDKTTDRKTAFGRAPRKLTKAAQKRVDDAIREALAEIEAGMPVSLVASTIQSYVQSEQMFESQQDKYKKLLVMYAKRLPVYAWVKGVPGFGDVSFATIVGECGDVGTYKSVSAVWKRLGLAVINGRRQGNPGEGATAQDWIEHGYNRARRSVSYVAREHVIGGMGKWRPEYGSNLGDATYYQRCYAERARYEAGKLGLPIERSDKGKESYKKHVAMRAHRYVEKRLLKHLYIEWRRAA